MSTATYHRLLWLLLIMLVGAGIWQIIPTIVGVVELIWNWQAEDPNSAFPAFYIYVIFQGVSVAVLIKMATSMNQYQQALLIIIQMFISTLLLISVFTAPSYHFPSLFHVISMAGLIVLGILQVVYKRSNKAV